MAQSPTATDTADLLLEKFRSRTATIGVMGLGYVGLPLAVSFARAGFPTLAFEVDAARLRALDAGESYIGDLSSHDLRAVTEARKFTATGDDGRLSEPDAIVICLPTPLGKAREPDLSILTGAFATMASRLRRGQLVVLSSTTYPGTTEELALPALESSGLRVGTDFFLAFSPERVDPGNKQFSLQSIPRIVGGITPACATVARALLQGVVDRVEIVSSCRAAEMTKLLENTFRSVNIGLVNEMALICQKLDIDVWEVIDAASTKPYGFMRFVPGPGLGGHCIPIDPAYLAWKLRMYNYRARFVELAEDINGQMPEHVATLVGTALNDYLGKTLRGARILALGLAYKRDVSDARESPSIEVIRHLMQRGALVDAHDPYVSDDHSNGFAVNRAPLSDDEIRQHDCVVILTDHSAYDWDQIVTHAQLVIDTRGVTRHVESVGGRIVRL
jgi:UDP-N-acetyl-D-glucosamine dehydrogenase